MNSATKTRLTITLVAAILFLHPIGVCQGTVTEQRISSHGCCSSESISSTEACNCFAIPAAPAATLFNTEAGPLQLTYLATTEGIASAAETNDPGPTPVPAVSFVRLYRFLVLHQILL